MAFVICSSLGIGHHGIFLKVFPLHANSGSEQETTKQNGKRGSAQTKANLRQAILLAVNGRCELGFRCMRYQLVCEQCIAVTVRCRRLQFDLFGKTDKVE